MNKDSFNKKIRIAMFSLLTLLLPVLFIAFNFTPDKSSKASKTTPIDANRMMSNITYLSKSGRQYGSDNEKKACEYLSSMLKSYGYSPRLQIFKDKITPKFGRIIEVKSQNLIAVKKNTTKTKKGTIIVCAHYDCEENSQGANDDAAGTAVVLEAARLLRNVSSAYEIRFILFGGEEYGCRGSSYYVGNLLNEDIRNIKADIDIDSIAQKDMVNPKVFTINGKENAATVLLKVASENKYLHVNKANREISDYAAFDYAGIPALCIGQPYTEDLKINDSEDNISLIDKTKLIYVANIIIKALSIK